MYGHWKSPLTTDDLTVSSAWNTYDSDRVPPTPIASPGLDSILAALRPAETAFFYFVASGDGGHLFAETFEQHSDNVTEYGASSAITTILDAGPGPNQPATTEAKDV